MFRVDLCQLNPVNTAHPDTNVFKNSSTSVCLFGSFGSESEGLCALLRALGNKHDNS